MTAGDSATPLLLDIGEAAACLSISKRHLINMLNAGTIRSLRIGRRRLVPVAALHEFIASREGAA